MPDSNHPNDVFKSFLDKGTSAQSDMHNIMKEHYQKEFEKSQREEKLRSEITRQYAGQMKRIMEDHLNEIFKKNNDLVDAYVVINSMINAYATGEMARIKECMDEAERLQKKLSEIIKSQIDKGLETPSKGEPEATAAYHQGKVTF